MIAPATLIVKIRRQLMPRLRLFHHNRGSGLEQKPSEATATISSWHHRILKLHLSSSGRHHQLSTYCQQSMSQATSITTSSEAEIQIMCNTLWKISAMSSISAATVKPVQMTTMIFIDRPGSSATNSTTLKELKRQLACPTTLIKTIGVKSPLPRQTENLWWKKRPNNATEVFLMSLIRQRYRRSLLTTTPIQPVKLALHLVSFITSWISAVAQKIAHRAPLAIAARTFLVMLPSKRPIQEQSPILCQSSATSLIKLICSLAWPLPGELQKSSNRAFSVRYITT